MPQPWIVIIVLVVGVALIAALRINARRKHFEFRITDGSIADRRGNVPDRFVGDVERICALWEIKQGTVRGVKGPRGMKIEATGMAADHRQAFQNAWDHPL